MRKTLFLCALLLGACASAGGQIFDGSLQPYLTRTPENTSTPNVIVIINTLVPTATPFVYIVQQGDTFSELAEKFKISTDDLQAMNPDVSPNSMSIGTNLLIPGSTQTQADASTPTPAPAPVTQTVCHPTANNGLWCFALIQNNTSGFLENTSAQITLGDQRSSIAFTPLDIIPPNSSIPVYVFFPDTPAELGINPQAQVLSAIQLSANPPRYLKATLNNTAAQIDWNGRAAQLSGEIFLPAESSAATQVWVAAVAYDQNGIVVGVRRWEGGAIQPGGRLKFNFAVSSLGSAIDAVEFFVEASPHSASPK